MTKANVFIAVVIAAVTFSLWALVNQPYQEPAWPDHIQGLTFSPLHADQSPMAGSYPSEEQIAADLALLAGKVRAVRTYTVEKTMAQVPVLAARYDINVALGAWIDNRLEKNETELTQLITLARANRNVIRAVVGNEVILRNDIPLEQLLDYLDRARDQLQVPVSAAEPWHIWLKYPELAQHVDYLAVHLLPYWEGISVDNAVDFAVDKVERLRAAFPDKPIVIAEVGWPSNGRTRQDAVASDANEAKFLRRFLVRATQEKYTYYVMEAFDQPWKQENEGTVGAYWGVYDVERRAKFPFSEPIVPVPNWQILAGLSVLIAAIKFALLLLDGTALRNSGRSFLAVVAFTAATAAVWIIYDYLNRYMTLGSIIVGILLAFGMVGIIMVLLAEAHEWAEARWIKERRRAFKPIPLAEQKLPMVSIHVPAYNEPPAMLIATLNALQRLDYPNYEVLVIDNNTRDPEVWQPVEAHCAQLGPRFRFFHVDPLAGFKAGALNFALQQTAAAAQIIAVIDSDYIVDRTWLRDLVPQFSNPKTGIVQAPQDYRDHDDNAFKAMCHAEYRGFFFIGMVTRNDRNAIIQHGTMTMIRKSVLQEVGGWSEWCITEDAELGLRVFEHGYEAVYDSRSYGKGLMPDTFLDFKKQRYRWAYGAVQILRRHLGILLDFKSNKLTTGQRYHFLAGWLPWIADGFNLLFTLAALCWSAAMILWPKSFDPPLVLFSILPLMLFGFKMGKLIYLYRTSVVSSHRQTIAAALAGLALSHTIAQAILLGFITSNKPFFRTPKLAYADPLRKALLSARQEALLMLALWGAVYGVTSQPGAGGADLMFWVTVLLTQSIPYFAAVVVALLSGFSSLPATLISERVVSPVSGTAPIILAPIAPIIPPALPAAQDFPPEEAKRVAGSDIQHPTDAP